MSDPLRKPFSDQVGETITPESQKTVFDKVVESATNYGDKVAAAIQPGDSKSTSQKLSDNIQTSSSTAPASGAPVADQAAAVGQNIKEGAAAASDGLKDTADRAGEAFATTSEEAQVQGQSILQEIKEGFSDVVEEVKRSYAELTTGKPEGAAIPTADGTTQFTGPGVLEQIQTTATSVVKNISETAQHYAAKATESADSTKGVAEPGSTNSVLAQVQEIAAKAYDTTSKGLSTLADKIAGEDELSVKDSKKPST